MISFRNILVASLLLAGVTLSMSAMESESQKKASQQFIVKCESDGNGKRTYYAVDNGTQMNTDRSMMAMPDVMDKSVMMSFSEVPENGKSACNSVYGKCVGICAAIAGLFLALDICLNR